MEPPKKALKDNGKNPPIKRKLQGTKTNITASNANAGSNDTKTLNRLQTVTLPEL